MGALISYTIESGLILLACYLMYKWLLSGRNEPSFSRAVILGSYCLAALLPAVWHNLPQLSAPAALGIDLGTPEVAAISAPVSPGQEGGWILKALCLVYAAGAVAVTVMTVASWRRISRLMNGGEIIETDSCEISVVDDSRIAPMSRMSRVMISREDFRSDIAGYILCHERAHIRHRHGYDLLIARLFEILMWYNPAAWLMASELRSVHEFQADGEVIASGADPRSYQIMLVKKVAGLSFQSMANNLNHSKLKKRITMMQKSKSRKGSRVLALAMAPALLVALSVTRIPAVAGTLSAMSRTMTELPSAVKVSEKSAESLAGEQKKSVQTSDNGAAAKVADQLPQYPGGEVALMEDLAATIVYPENASEDEAVHRVIVRFVVETDGSVSSPEIIRSAGETYDNAALEAVRKLKPFTPGISDGKPVAVTYTLPVNFRAKK
ncbi:MAG: M56 family metallopeptidase [Muribaculaceae bacterium]|nr:M56 family metallopeptidase [Muribaculaceae bacterium]